LSTSAPEDAVLDTRFEPGIIPFEPEVTERDHRGGYVIDLLEAEFLEDFLPLVRFEEQLSNTKSVSLLTSHSRILYAD
jgi:hypothetical protein